MGNPMPANEGAVFLVFHTEAGSVYHSLERIFSTLEAAERYQLALELEVIERGENPEVHKFYIQGRFVLK